MRILVVDDDPGIREIVTNVLTGAGFKVDSTGNGTRAFKMFRSRKYSLVITDLLHPGLNGAELIGKIRKLKPWHPVLLFTASPIPILAKPCVLADLLDAAKSLTERKKKSRRKPGGVIRAATMVLSVIACGCRKSPSTERLFISEHAVAGFLVSVRLSGGRQNRCCRLTEEAHQSLDVLSYRGQEELLAHEPESPQTQAPQPDLILQFCKQGLHFLSLPLCLGELWRVDQLPRTLSGWFVLVDDQAPEGSAGALWSERAWATQRGHGRVLDCRPAAPT